MAYENCVECPYKDSYKPVFYENPKKINRDIDIMFVLDKPNIYERNLQTSTNIDKKLLYAMCKRHNIDIKKCYITNVCKCNNADKRLKTKGIKACIEILRKEIDILNPKIVVGMGEEATKVLSGKNKAFSHLRGYINYNKDKKFFNINTFTPKNVIVSYTNYVDLNLDFIKLADLYNTITHNKNIDIQKIVEPVANLKYTNIDSIQKLEELNCITNHIVVLDIETSGLRKGDDVLLKGIYVLGKETDKITNLDNAKMYIIQENVIIDTRSHAVIERFLSCNHLVTQNGKFDIGFSCRAGNIKLDIRKLNNYFDTMVAHMCIDERMGTHGLKIWSKNYFNAHDWEDDIKQYLPNKDSSYSLIPRDKLAHYLTYDLYYTAKGYILFSNLLDSEETRDYFNILMELTNRLTLIEHRGIKISDNLLEVKRKLEEKQEIELKKLTKMVYEEGFTPTRYMQETGAKTAPADGEFKPTSYKQLAYVFYDLLNNNAGYELIPLWEDEKEKDESKKFKKSGCKEAVEAYRVKHPLWEQLYKYKAYTDVSFLKAIDKNLDPDKMLRTNFNVAVSTGRMSSTGVNFQNFKNGSVVKNLIEPDEDCYIIDFDYCTLEVIVSGIISQDQNILDVFRKGIDFHSMNTENIFKQELDFYSNITNINEIKNHVENNSILAQGRKKIIKCTSLENIQNAIFKAYRQKSKAVTFGVLYSRGAKSLAKKELNCETWQAKQWIDNFYEKFHTFKEWSDTTQELALTQGYITTWFGHKRRFPFVWEGSEAQIRRQAPNTVIQGTASQITANALMRIHDILEANFFKSRILFTVHDSIVCSVHKTELQEVLQVIKNEMIKNPIMPELPFGVEGEIGYNYGEKIPLIETKNGFTCSNSEINNYLEGNINVY